jgi:hypothetical protein
VPSAARLGEAKQSDPSHADLAARSLVEDVLLRGASQLRRLSERVGDRASKIVREALERVRHRIVSRHEER